MAGNDTVSALREAMGDYLAMRRAVGFKLEGPQRFLEDYVAFLEAAGEPRVTVATALEWAGRSPSPTQPAVRLAAVRGFATYFQTIDPATEIPPTSLLPARKRRPVPHLYSPDQITALMAAARALRPELRAATAETAIGLLATTGMRVGEVLALNDADVDAERGAVTVWFSKFNKSRHVPLHASTIAALAAYVTTRRRLCSEAEPSALFVTEAGARLGYQTLRNEFIGLRDHVGITGVNPPRLTDFRHSFATSTLLGWYSDGVDVQAVLPRLSTYLGHVAPRSTYWYLTATPQLLGLAAQRLEPDAGGGA
jgi:integrase